MHRIQIRSRTGAGEVLTTIIAIPFFAVLLSYMAYFGRALYARAAVEEAAAAGARFAVTSLSGEKGCRQAREVMVTALQGHYLDVAGARLSVRPLTGWGRGAQVEVSVNYTLHQMPTLFFSKMLGDPTLQSRYVVVVDTATNRYSNGWRPCVTAG